jgi:DNA-binding MarR family transcriptional regulator
LAPGGRTFDASEMEIDDNVNGFKNLQKPPKILASEGFIGTTLIMSQKMKRAVAATASPDSNEQMAPITAMMSSRLMVLANLLRRGAVLRYKRLAGLSSVEFGLVASLGRRPPMSVATLAEAVGMDKGQISRALAGLVSRKLVSRAVNPRDNREVLVGLSRAGLVAHETIVAGALERNRHLLEPFSEDEVAVLLAYIDRLTDTAAKMLDAEKGLS